MSRQNAIAKARREAFDLIFNGFGHIHLAIEWHVAVGPQGVFSVWSARIIEDALLRNQGQRTFRNFSTGDFALGLGDFIQSSTQMNCARLSARFRFPRNRRSQARNRF